MKTVQEIRNTIKKFRPISQKTNLFDPNINDRSNRLYRFKDEEGVKFIIWIFSDKIKVEIPLSTSLLFSINIPDMICFANKFIETMDGIGKLFTNNSKNKQVKLCVKLLEDDLIALNFNHTEGLIVYKNSLQMILKNDRQIIPEIEICKRIKSVIELYYPDKIYSIDYTDLPNDLLQLIERYESLAIPDDVEKEEKVQEMTKKEHTDFIEAIEQKFNDINIFLDSFGDKPLTEGAIKIQCLAELAMYIKQL
jgi:hypothetical protein